MLVLPNYLPMRWEPSRQGSQSYSGAVISSSHLASHGFAIGLFVTFPSNGFIFRKRSKKSWNTKTCENFCKIFKCQNVVITKNTYFFGLFLKVTEKFKFSTFLPFKWGVWQICMLCKTVKNWIWIFDSLPLKSNCELAIWRD